MDSPLGEAAVFAPDSFYQANPPVSDLLTTTPIQGAYHTNEAYAETLIPVFEPKQDVPGLNRVELEGAIRRVDNSIAGSSNTWDAGLRWAPTKDLLFRGNRTVSIRAPAITELGTDIIAPKTRASFAANDVKGPFSWYWQAQYTSGMNFSNLNTATSQDILTVGHWWLINSSLAYAVGGHVNVRLVVNNVFNNKEPPAFALAAAAANFTATTSYYFAGIVGRTYLLSVDAYLF